MSDLRPPRYLKPMNRVVKAIQKLGIPAGPSQILTVPGRRSGKLRSTPMTPFTHNGGLYTVAGYPGADWAANARAAGAGTLTRGRKSRQVKIIELSPEDAGPVLRSFAVEVPVGVGFAKRVGPGARRHRRRIRGARRRARRVPVRPGRLGGRRTRRSLRLTAVELLHQRVQVELAAVRDERVALEAVDVDPAHRHLGPGRRDPLELAGVRAHEPASGHTV